MVVGAEEQDDGAMSFLGEEEARATTGAPTRSPETVIISLLRSTPRWWLGSSREFDADDSFFYIDRGTVASIGALCIFLLVCYTLWAVARHCLWACQRSSHQMQKRAIHTSYRQRLALSTWIVLAMAVFAFGTIYGHSLARSSLRAATDATDALYEKFRELDDLALELVDASTTVNTLIETVDCDESSTWEELLEENAAVLEEEANDVRAQTDDVASAFRSVKRRTRRAWTWVDWALFLSVVAIIVSILPAAAYGMILSRRWAISLSSRFSYLMCAILVLLVALEFGVAVKLADFCRNPDRNVLDILETRANLGVEATDLVAYYVTCDGVNPVADDLIAAYADVQALNASLAEIRTSGACVPESAIEALRVVCGDVNDALLELETAVYCPPINEEYSDLVHTAVCRKFLPSLYFFAIVHAIIAAFLYVFLYAANWVCETILLEEEFWLLPHPEIFAPSPTSSRRAAAAGLGGEREEAINIEIDNSDRPARETGERGQDIAHI
ncbi:hypothetical protein CTAYLR_009833 [Chrysophaeum taylorii]|uniref:Uncharacterized protein n=1 Tax=Chrysophaeum taylorii TaxID=2483200 RepID=A0AAD7UB76_9STRA|nr:hypothetical protein CTAYLR_009833 [Chrysophaeum taylorii]